MRYKRDLRAGVPLVSSVSRVLIEDDLKRTGKGDPGIVSPRYQAIRRFPSPVGNSTSNPSFGRNSRGNMATPGCEVTTCIPEHATALCRPTNPQPVCRATRPGCVRDAREPAGEQQLMARKRKVDDPGDPARQDDAAPRAPDRRADMADLARRRAAHFAHFQDDDVADPGNVHAGGNEARTLGPWSSAVELVNAREQAAAQRQDKLRKAAEDAQAAAAQVDWAPQRDPSQGPRSSCRIPSLYSMALQLLVTHIDAVSTLWGVPDLIKTELAAAVSEKRKMTREVAQLFADSAPTELVLRDCTLLDSEAMCELLATAGSRRLERLELSLCGRGFGDAAAAVVAERVPLSGLRQLRLTGAYRLSDAGLQRLLQLCPSLQSLATPDACRLGGNLVTKLPELVPSLTELDLSSCRGVPGAALCSVLAGLPHLKRLNFSRLPEVTDEVLVVVSKLKNLHSLNLTACTSITDSGITALAAAQPPLESLSLDECHQLHDASLLAVAGGCRRLRQLSVRRCGRLTDDGLVAVAEAGQLQQLCVSGVPSVSTRTLQALTTHCKGSLEALDISFCTGVLEAAVGAAADACQALQTLKVFGCSQLTQRFLYGHSNEKLQVLGESTSCS